MVLFEAIFCLRLQRTLENSFIVVEGETKSISHFGINLASVTFSGLEGRQKISICIPWVCMAFAILSRYVRMDTTSSSPTSVVRSDKSVLTPPSRSLMSVVVDAKDPDMLEANVVEGPFGRDAKYAYAVPSGKAKIFRVNRPTLGSRK